METELRTFCDPNLQIAALRGCYVLMIPQKALQVPSRMCGSQRIPDTLFLYQNSEKLQTLFYSPICITVIEYDHQKSSACRQLGKLFINNINLDLFERAVKFLN
jgi:hypothetical protein